MFPERFSNKTNGVTPRRWLLLANPAARPTHHRGHRRRLGHRPGPTPQAAPLAEDTAFRASFRQAKRAAKVRFTDWLQSDHRPGGRSRVDLRQPDQAHSRVQAAIAERRCKSSSSTTACGRIPKTDVPPRTFFFAGKAAPAYQLAKLIIKLINNVAAVIDARSRRCAAGSRCCSCPITTSAWRSG